MSLASRFEPAIRDVWIYAFAGSMAAVRRSLNLREEWHRSQQARKNPAVFEVKAALKGSKGFHTASPNSVIRGELMPDYDLSGLSWRSFEQLVQSIAIREIGQGVIIFGDGPDGGREACYDGTIPYPDRGRPWQGYLVVQAKFKQRPEGNPNDREWILTECSKELDKFASSKRGLRSPDFYILATNIVLTAAHKKGTKDRLQELIASYRKKLGLKDFDVWDYDKICRFLDSHEDIRRSYSAWVTPGDVLAAAMQNILPKFTAFDEVITSFLQKELLVDQYARLEQSGHTPDSQVPLATVFVDLPAEDKPTFDPPGEDVEEVPNAGFLAEALEASQDRLAPSVVGVARGANPVVGGVHVQVPGRYVLIGGPGQGKTTLGQFVCQLFRVAILKRHLPARISPEARRAQEIIESQIAESHLQLPRVARFPFRAEMNDLAFRLSRSGIHSLLAYMVERINRRTDSDVNVAIMREWLAEYPWVIILDGLDEVSASSNRAEVLQAVREFWVDAASLDADVLVIATTRPQGYSQEYAPELYRHKWLTPLSAERALKYGKSLAKARYESDPDRLERVRTRLESASEQESTARLMRSPLQVTIMTTLVDRVGRPPEERWSLFSEYYNVMYQREVERDIPASVVLREHKPNIDAIHRRVGLLLQVASDNSRGAEANLKASDLRQIVEGRLKEEGHKSEALAMLSTSIIEAAMQRLVFLVGVTEDRIGFEIRSLQEFMAGEALMDGSDHDVADRLREIAPLTNWRNVMLFAAGNCFANRQHLRDTVQSICGALNEEVDGDPIFRMVYAGSQLAVDLLEDGPAKRQPKYALSLARLATRILDLPPHQNQIRLARLQSAMTGDILREEITSRLQKPNCADRLGAWHCLLESADRGVDWAQRLVATSFADESSRLELFKFNASDSLYSYIRTILPGVATLGSISLSNQPPFGERYAGILQRIQSESNEGESRYQSDWLNAAVAWAMGAWRFQRAGEFPFRIGSGQESLQLRLSLVSGFKRSPIAHVADMPDPSPLWQAALACGRFCDRPNKASLARELRFLATLPPGSWSALHTEWLAWPMGSCLSICSTQEELSHLATEVSSGKLGDYKDWIKGERRLLEEGVRTMDADYVASHALPFDKNISEIGFPMPMQWSLLVNELDACVPDFFRLLSEYRNTRLGLDFSRLALTALSHCRNARIGMNASDLGALVIDVIQEECDLESLLALWSQADCSILEKCQMLNRLGEQANFYRYWEGRQGYLHWMNQEGFQAVVDDISHHYAEDPSKSGIMRVLSIAVMSGYQVTLPAGLVKTIDYQRMENPKLAAAAICLRMALGPLSSAEAAGIAEFVVKNKVTMPNLDVDLMGIIHFGNLSGTFVERLLVGLRSALDASDWVKTGKCLLFIRDAVGRRPTVMSTYKEWKRLGLSESLFPLIERMAT